VLAPLIVVALAVPVIVVLSLLLVALADDAGHRQRWWPKRRFPALKRKRGAGRLASQRCGRWDTPLLALLLLVAEPAAVAGAAAGAGAAAADLGLADLPGDGLRRAGRRMPAPTSAARSCSEQRLGPLLAIGVVCG
jgi:hypothetical protein